MEFEDASDDKKGFAVKMWRCCHSLQLLQGTYEKFTETFSLLETTLQAS